MRYTANYGMKEPQKNVDLADIEDLNDNFEDIDEIMHNTQISLAPAYDQTSTYAVDDLVMYENLLYKCITAVTVAEAWDSTKWQRAVLSDSAGGGGNANVMELTYNQYLALSQAEKTNGTIYMVTDDPSDSSSGGGGGVNYSYTEQDTGLTWVDGKHIYQKTIEYTNSSVDLTSLNIDNVVDIGGVSYLIDGTVFLLNTYASSQHNTNIDISNNTLRLSMSGWTFAKAYITIWYTKTYPQA